MTSETYSSSSDRLTGRLLRIGGLSAIALAIIDLVTLLFPFNPLDRQWLQSFTSQSIDRGIVPAIGIALIFWSYWIESRGGRTPSPRSGISLVALVLSGVLGVLFLILSPIHLLNIRAQARDTLATIVREARQAEDQIDSNAFRDTISRRQSVLKQQAEELMRDEARFKALMENPQLNDQQRELLKRARDNPAELDAFVARQSKEFPLQLIGRIRERRKELEDQARTAALRSGLQTGVSGLLLSGGYLAIAWFGLGSGLLGKVSKARPRA